MHSKGTGNIFQLHTHWTAVFTTGKCIGWQYIRSFKSFVEVADKCSGLQISDEIFEIVQLHTTEPMLFLSDFVFNVKKEKNLTKKFIFCDRLGTVLYILAK